MKRDPDLIDDDDDEEEVEEATTEEVREFLETYPLYRRLPKVVAKYHGKLELYCPRCKRSLPFSPNYSFGSGAGVGSGGVRFVSPPQHRVTHYGPYACAGCPQALETWVEIDEAEGWSRKIGQVPSPTDLMPVPRDLVSALSVSDAEFYRKGATSLAVGYGLAACAYLRRILENETDTILDLLSATVADERGRDAPEVREINLVRGSKNFDTKAKLAATAELVPRSLYVAGLNPFKTLHDAFSEALHAKDEDSALGIASQLTQALEFIVCELHRRRDTHAAYARAVKERSDQVAKSKSNRRSKLPKAKD